VAGLGGGDLGDEVEELSSIGGCGSMGGASDIRGQAGSGGVGIKVEATMQIIKFLDLMRG
jgi:hypothetical protein